MLCQRSYSNEPFLLTTPNTLSKYCGNSWDGHRHNLSLALLEHLNGNAVYNLTHPYLRLMVKEMQDENNTPLKSVPYDVRMSQIVAEGSMGIPPDLPTNRSLGWGSVNVEADRIVLDTEKSYKFKTWWDHYGAIDNPMKETRAIRNMHINDYLPRHVRNGIIVHGAREYSSWNPEKNVSSGSDCSSDKDCVRVCVCVLAFFCKHQNLNCICLPSLRKLVWSSLVGEMLLYQTNSYIVCLQAVIHSRSWL